VEQLREERFVEQKYHGVSPDRQAYWLGSLEF
jgi:hypothetical protein